MPSLALRRLNARRLRSGAALRARRAPRGFACVLLVVGMLLSHTARLAHLLLVQHVLCEHGELVHGGAEGATPSAAIADERREQAAQRDTSSLKPSEHDHCDAPSILHRPLAAQPILPDGLAALGLAPPGLAEQAEIRAVAPIDFAPKGSPPRA